MSWLAVVPPALLAAGLLLGPGLAVALALGLRGILAWGVAPVASVAVIGSSAVVAGGLGVPWSPPVPLAAAGLAVLVAALGRAPARRRSPASRGGSGRESGWLRARAGGSEGGAAAAGLTVAALLGAATAAAGMQRPDALSQTFDAIFHYNAVARIRATGEASSLVVGVLAAPAAEVAFYPAGWHSLVALLVPAAGGSIPLASNAAAVVVAALVWPLSCLVLVRTLVGRSAPAMLVTPVVALAFIAFPWSLMTFGVLWPNLLGLALVPVGLAAAVTVAGLGRDGGLGCGQAVVIGSGCAVALGFAHPNTVFTLALVAAFPLGWGVVAAVRRFRGDGRGWAALGVSAAALAVGATAIYFWVFSPLFEVVREFDWPAYQTAPDAAREVLLHATNNQGAAWSLALAVLGGAAVATRHRALRWLLPAHVMTGALFVLASASDSAVSAALTGIWWNDPYRLAAMLPLTGVPLAVVGLLAAAGWAARTVRGPGPLPVAAALLAVLVAASGGLYLRDHAGFMTVTYPAAGGDFLDPARRAFLERIADDIPDGAVVAQNPWAGGALLFALTGHRVLFPHLDGEWTDDQRYLARNLRDAATDPRVCRIAADLGVTHAIAGPLAVAEWDQRAYFYPGIADLDEAPGFEFVEAGGGLALYRITACRGASEPAAG